MKNWYLIHTKIRQEQCALENLERQNFECFLPRIQKEKLSRGALTLAHEPLFPRYLFIHLATGLEAKSWAPIRSTLGVSRMVSFGNVPAKINADLIESIRARTESDASTVQRYFAPGEAVSITQGPFEGIEAIYQMQNGEGRVMVLLNILSKPVTLSIAPSSLRRIS
jgi:transcriptional antiterminator RfaH